MSEINLTTTNEKYFYHGDTTQISSDNEWPRCNYFNLTKLVSRFYWEESVDLGHLRCVGTLDSISTVFVGKRYSQGFSIFDISIAKNYITVFSKKNKLMIRNNPEIKLPYAASNIHHALCNETILITRKKIKWFTFKHPVIKLHSIHITTTMRLLIWCLETVWARHQFVVIIYWSTHSALSSDYKI